LGGLLTLGILGGAVVAAGVALWENIDVRQLTPGLAEAPPPVPDAEPPLPAAVAPGAFSAVVLRTEANASYFPDATYYDTEIAIWRDLLEGIGGTVREARTAEELAQTTPDDLMVLPEAPCLSPEELAAVGAHLRSGGSIATNWALGVRDGACEWRGWSTLLDVTGAEDIREIPSREGLFLTVPSGLPVSPGIDPGTRIELRPDPALALRMEGARVYWSDWALNPAPDPEGAAADVAVATVRTEEGGRVTWFGLRARQAVTPVDSVHVHRLLENGLLWAAGTPVASASPWPDAARGALVFVLDVEGRESFVNARDAAAAFRSEDLPISFFAVSQLVDGDEQLARDLASAGEIGTQTVDHTPLAGLTRQDQTVRLRRSWRDIESWVGAGPAGLRPPEEAFDATTLEAWADAGGRYVLAGNEARTGAPEVHHTASGPVVLVPRLIKDDYSIVVRDARLRARSLGEAFVAGIDKMRAIGGLAVVAGHTQIIVDGPRLEAFRTVADSARARGGWWIARADQVADWWLARSRLDLRWEDAEGTPELLVSLGSGVAMDDLWIDVVLPTVEDGAIPYVDGVSVEYEPEVWGMRTRVGSLGAGEVRRLSFRVPPEDAEEADQGP
jgi:peptidoglycan/xylan/chitin deacetylase (PgdA/CDA1 family)